MAWLVKFEEKAERQLKKLPVQDQLRINGKLQEIANSDRPRERGKSLKGNLGDRWRYRIGEYRIICNIKDKELIILIVKVGNRKDVYKK